MNSRTRKYRKQKLPKQRARYYSKAGQKYERTRRRTPKSRWLRARYNAGVRKKSFTLTLRTYTAIINRPCKYCGDSIANETGSGLDRINNDKGYVARNVNPCCSSCNRRRSRSMGAKEFEKQSLLNNYKKSKT